MAARWEILKFQESFACCSVGLENFNYIYIGQQLESNHYSTVSAKSNQIWKGKALNIITSSLHVKFGD